ncbi:MAG: helix-turn-helix transcriptional regulator [Clostridia bacterium]|nr:helix-turn-helix transcriptional regulator [Clostridia bacterium]
MNNYLMLSPRNKIKILEYLPKEEEMEKVALYFQNFSDGTRLKIIFCLAMCDMCVNDLATILNINQTTVSHQLKLLKSQNIVTYKRDGKIMLYSLNDNRVNDIMYLAVSK